MLKPSKRSVALKLLIHAGLLSGLFLTIAGAEEKTEPTTVAAAASESSGDLIGSRMVLHKLMQDPFLHQIYLEQQLKSLTHPVDRSLRRFFLSDPRLEEIYMAILQSQDSFLQDFERYADVSMYQLTRGVTKPYDRLDHIVEETARDLGFSPDAIANRKIYIKDGSGSLNAFTVSGSQNKIVVVVHSTLLEKMDEFEVRAVLGHEMGHIRASHPVNGYLLDAMFSIIYRTYTQGHIESPAPDESKIVNFTKFCIDGKVNDHVAGEQVGYEYIDQMLGKEFRTKRVNAFDAMMNGVVQVMLKIPEVERVALLQRFLALNLQALHDLNVPGETVEYFTEIYKNLPKAGIVRVDANQMKEELSVLGDAFSRAQEMSADRFGSSVSKNSYLASSMGKLLGLAFANENREGVLKALVAQAERFNQNVSEKERAAYMGGSHPSPVLRTQIIMNLPPTPDIFFANPFISLLILQDGVENQIKAVEQVMAQPNLDKKIAAQYKQQHDYIVKAQEEVKSLIVDQLISTESRIRVGGRNPRFDNMLQFVLVNKENYFEALQQINDALSDTQVQKNPALVEKLKQQKLGIEAVRSMFAEQLLLAVQKGLQTYAGKSALPSGKAQDLQLRLQQLSSAMGTPKTYEEVKAMRALRIELSALPEIRTKGSRIPIDCRHFTY